MSSIINDVIFSILSETIFPPLLITGVGFYFIGKSKIKRFALVTLVTLLYLVVITGQKIDCDKTSGMCKTSIYSVLGWNFNEKTYPLKGISNIQVYNSRSRYSISHVIAQTSTGTLSIPRAIILDNGAWDDIKTFRKFVNDPHILQYHKSVNNFLVIGAGLLIALLCWSLWEKYKAKKAESAES